MKANKWYNILLIMNSDFPLYSNWNPNCISIETRSFLRSWSHLPKNSLMENFTFCAVSTAIENNVHYFLHFSNFSSAWNTFLNKMTSIDRSINDQDKIKVSFIGIRLILPLITNLFQNASLKYILESNWSDRTFFKVKRVIVNA